MRHVVQTHLLFSLIATLAVAVAFAIPKSSHDSDGLAQRDANYRQGTIEYRFIGPTAAADTPSPDYRGKLVFGPQGSFLERLEKPNHLGEKVKSVTFVKGRGWRYTEIEEEHSIEVTFHDKEEEWLRNDDGRTMIQAVPCGPFGLGMGQAKGIQVAKSGENMQYTGALEDGLTFRLTARSDGTPLQLDYLNGEKLFGTWAYAGSIVASPSLRLPEKAEFKAPWLGTKGDRSFQILKADLVSEPKATELVTPWFRPGVEIVDHRVHPTVVWTYRDLLKANGGSTTLTPESLLKLSEGRAEPPARHPAERT